MAMLRNRPLWPNRLLGIRKHKYGEVSEWSKVVVSKTAALKGAEGSNPSLSAN
jgi:hypothetical protein